MSDSKFKTVKMEKVEEMLKQLMEMIQKNHEDLKNSQEDLRTEFKKSHEDMKKFLQDMRNDLKTELKNSQEEPTTELKNNQGTMKSSQETMTTEVKTEVEKKVQVIEEKVYIGEETATSAKNEAEKDVKRIKNEAEDKHEELKMENEGTDSAKSNGTIDSKVDTITNNAEHRAEFNDSAKEGEPSDSVAADSSNDVPKNEEETTIPQAACKVRKFAEKTYQEGGKEGEEGLTRALEDFGEVSLESENYKSAISDIKEGLRMREEIAASTVEEQQGKDRTKKLQRSQEGPYAIVTKPNDGGWRIPKRPRVKMRLVRLQLFEGSTDGVT